MQEDRNRLFAPNEDDDARKKREKRKNMAALTLLVYGFSPLPLYGVVGPIYNGGGIPRKIIEGYVISAGGALTLFLIGLIICLIQKYCCPETDHHRPRLGE